MAPIRSKRPNIRTRTSKTAAEDPRGKYAPPTGHDVASTTASEGQLPEPPTGSLKRKRDIFSDESDSWRLSKRDKRTVKHNALLGKVRDASIQKKPLKRRRPAKKLKTDIGDLANALPAVEYPASFNDTSKDEAEWEMVTDDDGDDTINGFRRARKTTTNNKMVMKSLRHRPGALKKKKVAEDQEIDRFRRNLAQMAQINQSVLPTAENSGSRPAKLANHQNNEVNVDANSGNSGHWAALRSFIAGTMEKYVAFAAG